MHKLINYDEAAIENMKEHNPNWAEIPDHPYRILIVGDSGSRKTNALLKDTIKAYFY